MIVISTSQVVGLLQFPFSRDEYEGHFFFLIARMLLVYSSLGTPIGSNKSSSSIGIIIGAAVGGSLLFLLLLLAGFYAFRQKKKAEKAAKQMDPFGKYWN